MIFVEAWCPILRLIDRSIAPFVRLSDFIWLDAIPPPPHHHQSDEFYHVGKDETVLEYKEMTNKASRMWRKRAPPL